MDNYIEYKATGYCNQFQNIFYTAAASDIKVEVNGQETTNYVWIYGLKYIQLGWTPDDGDRVRITNINMSSDPDPNLEQMRNDISVNTADIATLHAENNSQDTLISNNTAAIQSNDTDISNLQTEVANHDTSINNNTTAINTNASDITTLTGRVAANENDIANLGDQSANITDLQNRMTAEEAHSIVVDGQIATLDTKQQDQETRLQTMEYKYDHIAFGTRDIDNNVTTPVDLYDNGKGDTLLVDANTEYSATMEVEYRRSTDSEEVNVLVEYALMWDGTAWNISRTKTVAPFGSVLDGVNLTVTTNGNEGKISYTSSDMAGTNYMGTMRFKLYKTRNTL